MKVKNQPMDFETWLRYVDSAVEAYCGLGRDDLPDCCYSDWYESGMSPQAAARKAIKNAGE